MLGSSLSNTNNSASNTVALIIRLSKRLNSVGFGGRLLPSASIDVSYISDVV